MVYNHYGYVGIVSSEAERLMQAVVEEVEHLPDYHSQGEVSSNCIWKQQGTCSLCNIVGVTDVRHDWTANTYHSTVNCICGR